MQNELSMFQKCRKHFCIITKHKYEVFKVCMKAGLYWQGITHDLSKYLPSEFIEYAKYYNGAISPVDKAKQEKGCCEAWLHHRGYNPHHYEWWIDNLDKGGIPLPMPYKYAMEMVCDYIGAGKAYNPKGWTVIEPWRYWEQKKKTAKIHPSTMKFFDYIFSLFALEGCKALRGSKSKPLYKKAMEFSMDGENKKC